MPAKIRRLKKRLFEADGDNQQQNNQNQQPANDANNANQPQNNNANNAQPAAPANANAQQQNNNQSQQPANQPADANNQQNNQNQEQQQQQEDPKLAENREKAAACIKNITDVIAKNDPYALLAMNIPDVMMQTFPNLKDDPNAKDTMAKWEEFKKSPNKQSFDAVMDSFAQFANGGKPVEQNQNGQQGQGQQQQQSQQAPQGQNNAQPANQPAQPQASNESRKQKVANSQLNDEYKMQSFGKRLNEQLNSRKEIFRAQECLKEKTKPVINVR